MLPRFTYHPDPIATGSVEASAKTCLCCGQLRGYVYTGPVYAEQELDDAFCPWCIGDGSAAERFNANFTDPSGLCSELWDDVPDEVVEEVSRRTPGFTGWQESRWWTHCGDAGEYLGRAGHDDLTGRWADAVPAIRADILLGKGNWDSIFQALHPDGDATAYVFRCRHCGRLGGYVDMS